MRPFFSYGWIIAPVRVIAPTAEKIHRMHDEVTVEEAAKFYRECEY
ncbi:hypothetical protein M5X00_00115 [Paenibacillus alvei]|nr:hypothetical protein [Paenibacillus alvei]MCY9705787.1 hypothetical protein [Paenibacillus alvei]MCY9752672.1 hypothetical protein [Paenibacillus alvei]